ncbi:hypothetical protein TREMEDRAFT_34446 [Tremella mesenterica DSM 1558]|uniref:uncharacterized protein n=1 Tax=Tremella mesenterica (strain ATCC 24925 / CBS 8224 / DSM 1558 / NBRC 9311 / NRRL Y-6157 / RJB 2259-6 / UBC 559-6) TaxID=578456 RepID=UPI0003F49B98|nr:uncharacterized protein TREMEDRAFT_34446 [Tremella mesenterica DSM 1558]EIW66886.1 hypothetical protein TREMEDRAFT_34446 [Tremella mesenterica DSM 1558]
MTRPRRARKGPITQVITRHITKPPLSSKAAQATISAYHVLLKKRDRLLVRRRSQGGSRSSPELKQVEAEIEALGGLDAYQQASIMGQSTVRGGDSSRVLIPWLKERPSSMLEIGALLPDNMAECSSWIDNHPIDLQSQHPLILQQDFFHRPVPVKGSDEWFDIISCSLVLNFVTSPIQRGRMLQLCHRHLRPDPSSLLFLVLPLPCLFNSRYTTVSSLRSLMKTIGFELAAERWKPGGKVGYWLWAWRQVETNVGTSQWTRKSSVQRDTGRRNNFAILLPPDEK